MKDITTRADIEHLVNTFYDKIMVDDKIGFFFTEVANLDWDKHLPKMYSFWETILLSKTSYTGNPMAKHVALNKKESMKHEHFDHWIKLWKATVNTNFEGKNASEAIKRATLMAELMKFKTSDKENNSLFNS